MADINLKAPAGANKDKTRVGRGRASGKGKTAGKGHKGQNARSGGGNAYAGFEGGQMPLYRRVARRGFSNMPFKKEYVCINVGTLEKVYADSEKVNLETLVAKRLIKKSEVEVKILGDGEISKKLEVEIKKVSKSAKEKIEKAGGKVLSE